MLRKRHPVDKLFEEIAVHFPKMDARLEKIDGYLEDEQVPARYFRVSHQELAMATHWAPCVLGAAILAGLALYAWRRLVVHLESPLSEMILLRQKMTNDMLPGQLEVELSV